MLILCKAKAIYLACANLKAKEIKYKNIQIFIRAYHVM